MSNLPRGVATVALTAAISVAVGCGGVAKPPTAPPDVEIVSVQHQKDVPIIREFVATLTGLVNAKIRAQVSGYLVKQLCINGAYVKKGTPLFQLDPRTFQAAVDQAGGNLAQAKADLEKANAQLGKTELDVKRYTPLAKQGAISQIPVGLPSALLERRPDVLSAEQQVRAANAQIGVATANFFPQLGLTALVKQASQPLSDVTSGKGNVWSIAGNFTGPIYEGGLLRAQKRQSVAFWEQSKLQYEQAALNAFSDFANALISRQKYEAIRDQQARSVAAYQQAVQIALQRYQAGKASYFEVLDAQIELYPEETSLAQTETNRRIVIVQLYLALGGGWNLSDSDWQNMTVTQSPPAAAPKSNP